MQKKNPSKIKTQNEKKEVYNNNNNILNYLKTHYKYIQMLFKLYFLIQKYCTKSENNSIRTAEISGDKAYIQ